MVAFALLSCGLSANFAHARLSVGTAHGLPAMVDLSAYQTPIRNQGAQRTCIVFSAVAALEAAYAHAGYGQLDLSEAMVNHFGKMMWLEPNWATTVARGDDGRESQVGAFGGGNGAQYLRELASGLRTTVETAMPYRSSGFNRNEFPSLANSWDSTYWTQRRANDFNLDPNVLPRAALTQPFYYSVRQFRTIGGNDPDVIEGVLADGHEVVWDFRVGGLVNPRGAVIWQPCTSSSQCESNGAHAMLIIGYDRTDPDPAKHYFLVKNSWGRTAWPDGYTRISYAYLRANGLKGSYVTDVEPPRPWPELAFIGRWTLAARDLNGTLDIYHVPGVSQWLIREHRGVDPDRRVGMFYDNAGKPFRVNGRIFPDRVELYIDPAEPNAHWHKIGGLRLVITRPVDGAMKGYYFNAKGEKIEASATLAVRSAHPPTAPE